MRYLGILAVCLLILSSAAAADEFSRVGFFGGFSVVHFEEGSPSNLYGWQLDVSGSRHRVFQWTAGVAGQYNRSAGTTIQQYEFLGGLRAIARGDRIEGFAHALVGLEAVSGGGSSDTGLALGLGGGLDMDLGERTAIRLIQFDYIPNRFSDMWFNDLRFAVGLVFRSKPTPGG